MMQSCIGPAVDPFNVSDGCSCSHQQAECNGVGSHGQRRVEVGFLVGHCLWSQMLLSSLGARFLPDHVLYCWQKSLRKMTEDCISNVCMIN